VIADHLLGEGFGLARLQLRLDELGNLDFVMTAAENERSNLLVGRLTARLPGGQTSLPRLERGWW